MYSWATPHGSNYLEVSNGTFPTVMTSQMSHLAPLHCSNQWQYKSNIELTESKKRILSLKAC